MKRYLTIVVCAAACLLTLGACDSHLRNSPEDLQLPRSTTDKQLAQKVKGLTNLEKLGLIGCSKITDAGLVHLKGLTTLKSLNLWDCDQITDAGVQSLQKALPDCRIMKNLSIR